MQGSGLLGAILIGGIAGWIAGRLMRSDQGLIANIVVGIVGAIVGNGILTFVTGQTLGGVPGHLIVGAAGACLLIWAYRVLRGR